MVRASSVLVVSHMLSCLKVAEMTSQYKGRALPDKPGGKVKGRGHVVRIRTTNPKPGKYIHVRVVSKKGPRGGHTIAGAVQTKKKKSRCRRKRRK